MSVRGGKQLNADDRLAIIAECRKSRAEDTRNKVPKPNISGVAKDLGHSRSVVLKWWNRRHQLDAAGLPQSVHAGNSGRKVHKAFATKKKVDAAIELREELKPGEHAPDASKKLGCHRLPPINLCFC